MQLQFNCTEVNTSSQDNRHIVAIINGVSEKDVLDHFSVQEVIDHFDEEKILDAIGQSRVEQYFNLQEKED